MPLVHDFAHNVMILRYR